MRFRFVLVCLVASFLTQPAWAQSRGRNSRAGNSQSAAAAAGARMGAQLNATRNRLRAEEKARINSPEYKAKKLAAAQRSAEHKADTKAEHDRFEASKLAHPPRLTPEQLDPETGEISWPKLLRGDSYAEHRLALDALFSRRAKAKAPLDGFAAHLKRHTDALQAALKQEIGSAKANDYAAARRFLDSLAEEAQHPSREEPPDE